jgi:hypothetical protein
LPDFPELNAPLHQYQLTLAGIAVESDEGMKV